MKPPLLLDLIKRPTKDLDIVAIVHVGKYVTAEPLPDFLRTAVRDVAAAAGLAENWLNPGPASLLDFGLRAAGRNPTLRRADGPRGNSLLRTVRDWLWRTAIASALATP
jgi:hypothetical protein